MLEKMKGKAKEAVDGGVDAISGIQLDAGENPMYNLMMKVSFWYCYAVVVRNE